MRVFFLMHFSAKSAKIKKTCKKNTDVGKTSDKATNIKNGKCKKRMRGSEVDGGKDCSVEDGAGGPAVKKVKLLYDSSQEFKKPKKGITVMQ